MKVLITGVHGMLGTDVLSVCEARDISVVGFGKEVFDITNLEKLDTVLEEESPTHIINCAAYTAVDAAEDDRDTCFTLNVTGVRNLAALSKKRQIKLIQISTDYVFDGSEKYYPEDAATCPINHYGSTKLESEEIVTRELTDYIVVRTAWLFGAHGKNFVDTIRTLLNSRDSIKVVDDQVGTPTYTVDLADALCDLLDATPGIYHITNDGMCSWHAFASLIAEYIHTDAAVHPCSSDEYPQVAKRPAYSVLKNTKYPKLRKWEDALKDYLTHA